MRPEAKPIGVELIEERHDDGPVHWACELGPVHVAVYADPNDAGDTSPATIDAPRYRHPGATLVGTYEI